MINPHITSLYQFRPRRKYTYNIFIDNMLWAAKPHHFNDPFDCDLNIAVRVRPKDVLKYAAVSYSNGFPSHIQTYLDTNIVNNRFTHAEKNRIEGETQKYIQANRNSGVVCLSEDWRNILMWAHYAQGHSGLCIEYSRTPADNCGNDYICRPVTYSKRYPRISFGNMLMNHNGDETEKMLFYKSRDWKYEKEWRLVTERGDTTCHLPGRILSVTFGLKASGYFINKVRRTINDLDVRLYKAEKANKRFELARNPI